MFKRFQAAKGHTPFPPIEEDIRCPQCGFNHEGWAFEPGFAKLCVKCGRVLEAAEALDRAEAKNEAETGFFGRLLGGLFGKKREEPEEEEAEVNPEAAHRTPHATGPADPGIFPEAVESGKERKEEDEIPEGLQDEPGEGPEFLEGYGESQDTEAARVGNCKKEGRLLAAQGRYEEAIEMLQKVVDFEPNDLESWAELGRIHYMGTKDLAKSIECSRKALAIDDDLVSVKCNLCLALLFDGQFEPAEKGFLEVIQSVRNSRGYGEEFEGNCKALLHDCLGELYASKMEASGELLDHIKDIIELLEIEKIYFH
jgi:tetratricopeptide (TPR) repeat protein